MGKGPIVNAIGSGEGAGSDEKCRGRLVQNQDWKEVGVVFVEGHPFLAVGQRMGWVWGFAQVKCNEEMCFLYSR